MSVDPRPSGYLGFMPLDQTLPNDLRAPREARLAISQFLTRAGLPQLVDDAQLLASELVTNAVQHACGPIKVRASLSEGFVRIEVSDSATATAPARRRAAPTDEGGRGMELVEKLSVRWGWKVTPENKVVWLDLRV